MSLTGIKKIGKYDVEKVIGRGGMGVVFKAIDPTLDRPVAIKMMTAGYADDPDLLKRFYREAQFTASLHHPNIVTVYDLGDLEGNPYFVMEFLLGESLDSIISGGRDVPLVQKIGYITQVCAGLEYAHQQRVIHRDIKPANIVVLQEGVVKIVDFGIARVGDDRLTRPRQVMGSYHYMAPEQINDGEIDARTDIFSTGVVLYQLLTQKLPFAGADIVSTLMKVMNDPVPPLSEHISDYPPELDAIVGRALEKNKDNRYESAEDFAFDLLQVEETLKQKAVAGLVLAAESLLEKGELTAARQEAQQALKFDRQSVHANELMRRIQQLILKRQHVEQSKAFVRKAEEQLSDRDFDGAIRSLDQARTLDPSASDLGKLVESVRELKTRADKFLNAMRDAGAAHAAGRLDEARSAIEYALEIEPESPQALSLQQNIMRDLEERRRREELQRLLRDADSHISQGQHEYALALLAEARKIDSGAAEIAELEQRANSALDEQRRRHELEKAIAAIEAALGSGDYALACSTSADALQRFPADPHLLQLKDQSEKERAESERKRWISEQIEAAQNLLDGGNAADALGVLEAAAQKYPEEPSFHASLSVVREKLEREAAERKKAEYIREANDALLRKAYDDAINKLETAVSESHDNDLERLLHLAREQRDQHLRELKAEAALTEARRLIEAEKFQQAINLLEAESHQVADERLNVMLSQARRRLADFERGVQEAIATSERLLDQERADQAVALLSSQPQLYSQVPEFVAALQAAQQMQSRLQAVGAAKKKIWTALNTANLNLASSLLDESRREFGARKDFDQLQQEIEHEGQRLRLRALERALEEAEALARMGSHVAALQKLQSASELIADVPDTLRERHELIRRSSVEAIERQKQQAEERERARVEAERREQERKQREREAEEKARLEAEARKQRLREEAQARERARIEAEVRERKRIEAERIERERLERERLAAEESARQKAAEQARQIKEAEQRLWIEAHAREQKRLEAERLERERKAREERPEAFEPTADLPRIRVTPPRPSPLPPRDRDRRTTPLPARSAHEETIAELTPPEGMVFSGPSSPQVAGSETATFGPHALDSMPEMTAPPVSEPLPAPPPAEPLRTEVPRPVTLPQPVPQPVTVPRRSSAFPKRAAIGAGVALALLAGAVALFLRPHAATPVAVQFATSPPGATVRVNGQTCVSPCSMSLAEGEYVADASLDGYTLTQQRFWASRTGSAGPVNLTLKPSSPGAPSASVSTPAAPPVTTPVTPSVSSPVVESAPKGTLVVRSNVDGANVTVNDLPYGTISGGMLRIPLDPGKYKVNIQKEGYLPTPARRANIAKGSESQVAFELAASSKPSAPAGNMPTAPVQKPQEQASAAAQKPASTPPAQQNQSQPAPPAISSASQPQSPKPVDDGSQLWASISNAGKRDDFENFRKRYPNSPYADQAGKKIEQLDWEAARDKKDENAVGAFLNRYPNSSYADEARRELSSLRTQRQVGADRQAIVAVLGKYEASYNNRDSAALAAIWPNLSKNELKQYSDSFKRADAVHMRLDYSEPTVAGDRANVNCRRTVQFVFKNGVQPERADNVTISLRKADGQWRLESVRPQGSNSQQ